MMKIAQIVVNTPPAVDGIADYSLSLAQGLLQTHGITTHFIVCQTRSPVAASLHNFPVTQLSAPTPEAFLQALPEVDQVILHYTDVYDPTYGAPFWLAEAIATAKQQQKFKKLIVLFHEFPVLYLWSKKLPLYPSQFKAACRIAELADQILATNSHFKAKIERRYRKPVQVMPVFSNIGEPDQVPALEGRDRRLIVFGGRSRRGRIYQKRSAAALANACRLLEIEEICDIGPSIHLDRSPINGVRFLELGQQPAEQISALMLKSIAGIAYSSNNGTLSKSSVFAAYCAHGLVPVITLNQSSAPDGLQAGQNFLFAGDRQPASLQAIAQGGQDWYRQHTLARTVEAFAVHLNGTKHIPHKVMAFES